MIEFALLAACLEHNTDHQLIRAIAKQESNYVSTAFYINKWEHGQFADLTLNEAVLVAQRFVDEGYTVDVGLMGINSVNIKKYGMSIREAFDPCTNINIGEDILYKNKEYAQRKGHSNDNALRVALSIYNTGSMERGFSNGYVDSVWGEFTVLSDHEANEGDITVEWESFSTLKLPERVSPQWLTRGKE